MPDLTKAYRNVFHELSDPLKYDVRTVHDHYVVKKGICNNEKTTVVIRVDVDSAFHLSIPLIEELSRYNLKSTHYFLTFPERYYNIWDSTILKKIIDKGHEIGLHTDHLYEQIKFNIDGIKSLKQDIKRLSELISEPIKGMVFHGHPEIDKHGLRNWDLYKNIDPSDLGLEYTDGYKSCYITPESKTWKPKCDLQLTDYMGFPYSWGWNYLPNYAVKKIKKNAKPGNLLHISFHTQSAFKYWIDWDYSYNETPLKHDSFTIFWYKKIIIWINWVVIPFFVKILDKFGIEEQLIVKIYRKFFKKCQ